MSLAHRPQFQLVAIDCPDPVQLAIFYSQLCGLDLKDLEPDDDGQVTWVELTHDGQPAIAFQMIEHYVAPTWPSGPVPQQMHLDFTVDDLDDGEHYAVGLGARLAEYQPDESFRVFFDPAGHPFCLVRRHD